MLVVSEYLLRDLGGGDPYEDDGDDEDEPRAVLETGTHTPRRLLRLCGAGVGGKASNLTARGVEWRRAAPQHMLAVDSVGELRPIARPASLPHGKREARGRRGGRTVSGGARRRWWVG